MNRIVSMIVALSVLGASVALVSLDKGSPLIRKEPVAMLVI